MAKRQSSSKPQGRNTKRPSHRFDSKSKKQKAHHTEPKAPLPKLKGMLLYGTHAVTEALKNPDRKTHALYIAEGTEPPAGLAPPITLPKTDLDRMLPKGAVHQGIALDCTPLSEYDAQDLIIAHQGEESSTLLILDQVTDPHNVGAIIRSASAFGCAGIIQQRKHAPELAGVLAKTACGGLEHTKIAHETNLSRAIETLQSAGYFVYGLDERGEQTIGQIKPGGKQVIVLGAEGAGLRRLVAEKCDALIKLPTQPPIASLNVSNAAAIALYALSQ